MSTAVAELIVASLKMTGVKRIYGVVGDSLNCITDAIRRDGSIRCAYRLGRRRPLRATRPHVGSKPQTRSYRDIQSSTLSQRHPYWP